MISCTTESGLLVSRRGQRGVTSLRKITSRIAASMALVASAASAQMSAQVPSPVQGSVIIQASPSAPDALPPAPTDIIYLKAGTPVTIETTVRLSSKTSRSGDRFVIGLAYPLTVNGYALIRAGIRGEGEVVHAAKAGWGGKAGEFIANARFLDCGSVRLPLGHLHWSKRGSNRVGEAVALGMAFTPAIFFVNGGEVEIPAGTSGEARLTADVAIPRADADACLAEPVSVNP